MEEGPKVWFDDKNGIVINGGKPATTVEATRAALKEVGELLEGKPRRLLLVDLTDAPLKLPAETRTTLLEESAKLSLDKQAFVVPNPVVRMLAKAIARVTSSAVEAGFFAEAKQAAEWLKQED